MIPAKEGCCEETVMRGHIPLPCNEPATHMVGWPGEGPYRMCEMHEHHSVKNRNAESTKIKEIEDD